MLAGSQKKFGCADHHLTRRRLHCREVELHDPFESMGAQWSRKSPPRLEHHVAGDGTTTATVLAQALITEGGATSPPGPARPGSRKGIEKGAQGGRLINRHKYVNLCGKSQHPIWLRTLLQVTRWRGCSITDFATEPPGRDFGFELSLTEDVVSQERVSLSEVSCLRFLFKQLQWPTAVHTSCPCSRR